MWWRCWRQALGRPASSAAILEFIGLRVARRQARRRPCGSSPRSSTRSGRSGVVMRRKFLIRQRKFSTRWRLASSVADQGAPEACGRFPEHATMASSEAEWLDGQWQRLQNTVDGLQADLSAAFPFAPSPRMCAYLVLAEDRRFPHHPGFDPLALCRAAWCTSFGGQRQGGSTIAMQLVRTVVGRREPTLRRKASEVALAVRLSRYVSNEMIPMLYLWAAYYGWNMEGFCRACQALEIDPRCSTATEDAGLVARLKYPQPKSHDAAQLVRIRTRVAHIIRLAPRRTCTSWRKDDAI